MARGFASLSKEKRRELATKGGANVPKEKRSFNNKELASRAGKIGGGRVPKERRSFSTNKELAREAGRKGGSVRRIKERQV